MKKALMCMMVTASCGQPPPVAAIQLAEGTAKVTATVTNIKPGVGSLYCALFNAADGFPGPSPIIGGQLGTPAAEASMPCVFSKLPAGDYAVSVYQDENSDGKINTNSFGAPLERYGASNNKLPLTAPPSFLDSKIQLGDGQSVELTINMK